MNHFLHKILALALCLSTAVLAPYKGADGYIIKCTYDEQATDEHFPTISIEDGGAFTYPAPGDLGLRFAHQYCTTCETYNAGHFFNGDGILMHQGTCGFKLHRTTEQAEANAILIPNEGNLRILDA